MGESLRQAAALDRERLYFGLSYKRLETGAFTWPPVRDGAIMLNALQLRLLFTGMDWTQIGVRTVPMPAE